jgi:saccharopine dehydrogenase-like NADP-dependent oxidoreductase
MRKILLFGAGKSATALIDYLLRYALTENWIVTVVDANLLLAQSKIGNALGGRAVSFDIQSDEDRQHHIRSSDLVISLLPPALHICVARDCVQFGKHLLTASYVDAEMKELQGAIESKGLLFLCEMGLDPGIDHMSAKKMVDDIHNEGGTITSFHSHCGGLVAPQSDDNPWHYKVSWNPRNIVLAGKSGASFKENGQTIHLPYAALFATKRAVTLPGGEQLCWYPNRDSLGYAATYGLEHCSTFIRTTLRHPDFVYGWNNVIELGLTDEAVVYETGGKSLMHFFREHMASKGFADWLHQKMQVQFNASKTILQDLVSLVGKEKEGVSASAEGVEEFLIVNPEGALQALDIDDVKTAAAATVADRIHDAKLTLQQLFFLGMNDDKLLINRGPASAADILQFALEKKLALQPGDKDRVVMLHQIEWRAGGKTYRQAASLVVEGEDDNHTAMAKTVGLPLGIAAKLLLNGLIRLTGLRIPVDPEIYNPVLGELESQGIVFKETTEEVT